MELRVHPVDSLDHPPLQPYRTLRLQHDHHQQRVFIAEGTKLVERLLESPIGVISVVLPEGWLPHFEHRLRRRPEAAIDVYVAPKAVLEELIGFVLYQGVMALGRVPDPTPLDELLARCPRPWLFLALDGLANAENLGAIVRNAAGFGVQGLLVGETTSHPYLRRSVRASMGTLFQMPCVEPASLAASLRELRRLGVRIVAAHAHAEERRLSQSELTGDVCIVMGSEGHGLSPAVLSACDEHVMIPMAGGVDSLNVAAAAAVFLYEVARQRGRV